MPHLLHVIDFHLLVVDFDHFGHVQCLCHFWQDLVVWTGLVLGGVDFICM